MKILKNKNIVIIGGGNHCKCIIDILEYDASYNIIGVIDSIAEIGSSIAGYKVIGKQNELLKLMQEFSFDKGIIAVGDNYSRYIIEKELLNQFKDFTFINAIHPSAIISKSAIIGYGNVIMPGVVVNVGAKIHNHCIINTKSTLEHFSEMHNFSSLSAGVITGGYVTLKEFSAIALGVTVFDRVTIGVNSVIGSASLVNKDIPDHVLAFGVPAEVKRNREFNERFLK